MNDFLQNENRKGFQLERLVLFSDAVFAIAITILVIELKIPDIPSNSVTDNDLLVALAHLIPKFIGFLVSFLLIGQYWTVHHRLFGYATNYNSRLVWLNIFFLLSVALMPFSTGFYSEYVLSGVITPVVFYTLNIALIGLINYYMWHYVGNPKNKLSENMNAPLTRYFSTRALSVPLFFILFAFLYIWKPMIAFWIPPLIPLIIKFAFANLKKKAIAATQKMKKK
ncbi:MAG: DUF1211 domain-containing protein [Bacteroidetes bacterium]|nr:DUF1211 domain-containing protein [Bacteroidota bacterium]